VTSTQRIIASADAMRTLGRELALELSKISAGPVIITLQGELGAGKTTLVRGLLEAFGVIGAVRSPTYTLIEPYELAGRRIYHLDLYRLGNARDLDGLGVRDLLEADAILLIEWPERAGEGALPSADLEIQIAYAGVHSSARHPDIQKVAVPDGVAVDEPASQRGSSAVLAGEGHALESRRITLRSLTFRGERLVISVQSS
jgi:tRNA threonylcarbamoyladenosine biosynthesis protein TsaE